MNDAANECEIMSDTSDVNADIMRFSECTADAHKALNGACFVVYLANSGLVLFA